jgi:hypothetical protein
MAETPRQIPPELRRDAKTDPVLAHMIEFGLPLNRQTWIDVNWGSEVPKPSHGRPRTRRSCRRRSGGPSKVASLPYASLAA